MNQEYELEPDSVKQHRLNWVKHKQEKCGPFRGYFSHVGNHMVLEVGMSGSYKMAIDHLEGNRNLTDMNDVRQRPFHKLKVQMKKQMLEHIDALFGNLETKHFYDDDCILWEGDANPNNKKLKKLTNASE